MPVDVGRTHIAEVVQRFYRGASVSDTATFYGMKKHHVEAILRQQIIELAESYFAVMQQPQPTPPAMEIVHTVPDDGR